MKIKDKAHFLKLLEKAIPETEKAWKNAKPGLPSPPQPGQYKALLDYLLKIQKNVTSGKLPSPNQRMRESLGWILVDNWDPADPLGALILELDTYYLKKM